MRHSPRFLSTFEVARPNFGESGRQKSDIHSGFCLLSRSRDLISEILVDKNEAFTQVFVYFRGWAADFGEPGRQKSDISTGFCLLSKSCGPNLEAAVLLSGPHQARLRSNHLFHNFACKLQRHHGNSTESRMPLMPTALDFS